MKPNGLRSSWRSDASGTTMRSKVQTESNASSSTRRARSTISLTVTLSRKFGRYSASFIVNRPPSCYLHLRGSGKTADESHFLSRQSERQSSSNGSRLVWFALRRRGDARIETCFDKAIASLTVGTGILARVQPRQAFLDKTVFGRLQLRSLIECANMEMRQCHLGQAFARQSRAAPPAKSAACLSGRGIELGDLAFGHRIGSRLECDEDRDRSAGMSSTTLAMTPVHAFGLTGRGKTDRPA